MNEQGNFVAASDAIGTLTECQESNQSSFDQAYTFSFSQISVDFSFVREKQKVWSSEGTDKDLQRI